MMLAIKNNERIQATPKDKAACPLCKEEVISKCGLIKRWHWSHKSNSDCDSWGEGETEWHIGWKDSFPKEWQEVVIENHRADIQLPSGTILELQNSPMSPEEVNERELFYKDMIWMINGETFATGLYLRDKTTYFSFVWKNPPKSWWVADKPVYVDLSLKIKLLDDEIKDITEKGSVIIKELRTIIGIEESLVLGLDEIGLENIKRYFIKNNYSASSENMQRDYVRQEILMYFGEYAERLYIELIKLFDTLRICEKKRGDINGKEILLIKKIYPKIPCGGWGILLSREEFLNKYGI